MNLASSTQNLALFHSTLKYCIDTKNSTSRLAFFRQLLQSNVKPTDFTFSLLLKPSTKSSSSLYSILDANLIQTHLVKLGIDQFVYVSTSLLDLHMKLGCNYSARRLFDYMPNRDIVIWNALICGYSKNGYDFDALRLFVQLLREGFIPCETTLVSVLPSCGRQDLVCQGRSIHGFSVKTGLDLDSDVKNVLILMYGKCSDLRAAELLFEYMVEKSVVSWNTVIGAYGQNGLFDKAMLVFKNMRERRVEVNSVTVLSLLSANADPESAHSYVIKTGLINYVSVTTSLICVYARSGDTESAELLYKLLPEENLVSLTAIISSYAEKGNLGLVMERFAQMLQLDMKPDALSMVGILHGITNPDHINIGLAFHGYGVKSGLCTDCLVANVLITMYSKFSDIDAVFSLFSKMSKMSLVSWNSVISACVQVGRASDAMELFCQMQIFGLRPDAITIASLLSGCSQLGYMQLGKKLHCCLLRNKLEMEDFVGTALIDMYIKCGSIEQAEKVFKSIKQPCLATWNSMITGYSLNGFEQAALTCYSAMRKQGLKPDKITFLGVLAACTHAALIDEGRRYFQIMTEEFGITPTLQHFACMVDLLGRTGLFEEAIVFIKNMVIEPDFAVWGALLSACCMHQNVKLGECIARKLYFLDYKNGGLYVSMSNLYAAKGMWDDVARVREMMGDSGGDGRSGHSLIEVTSTGRRKL